MQSLYNEEQIKNTKYNSKNHTKIIKRHERRQDVLSRLAFTVQTAQNVIS